MTRLGVVPFLCFSSAHKDRQNSGQKIQLLASKSKETQTQELRAHTHTHTHKCAHADMDSSKYTLTLAHTHRYTHVDADSLTPSLKAKKLTERREESLVNVDKLSTNKDVY